MDCCFAAMTTDSTVLLAVGGAVVIVIYLTIRPKKAKKDPLDKPLGFSSLAQRREVERQMENVLVELSEMARQTTAQIDTRAAKLELLLGEAREVIARLEQLRDSGDAVAREARRLMNPIIDVDLERVELPAKSPVAEDAAAADRIATVPDAHSTLVARSRLDVITSMNDEQAEKPVATPHAHTTVVGHAGAERRIPPPTVEQRIDAARQTLAEAVPARPAVRIEPPSVTPPEANVLRDVDPRHAAVYALADRGSAAGEIATQLGRPRGEVELILALRPKRPEAARE